MNQNVRGGTRAVEACPSASVDTEWLYEVARRAQEILCEIRGGALDSGQSVRLMAGLPKARTVLEQLVWQGFILDILLGLVEDSSSTRADRTINVLRRLLDGVTRPMAVMTTPARRVADLIRLEYREPLDVVGLACRVRCHPARLRRTFREEFGIPMRTFHIRVRVAAAVVMFADGTKVSGVARSVGYRSDKNLYRVLREVAGATPSELRSKSLEVLEELASTLRPHVVDCSSTSRQISCQGHASHG
jgi:AraC-like DNA-binding protein